MSGKRSRSPSHASWTDQDAQRKQKIGKSEEEMGLDAVHPSGSGPVEEGISQQQQELSQAYMTAVEKSTGQDNDHFAHLLHSNKTWASKLAAEDPTFFPACAQGQAPPVLYLGCADSRVPETTILGCRPGEVFTHRNIANIVSNTDVSLLSIVQYAVFHLKVRHIVVCGHTSCGGVAASLDNSKLDILDVWLQPLRVLRERYHDELEHMSMDERRHFIAEKNVQNGMENLKRIPTVIDAIQERGLKIHGVIYNLGTGLLEEVAYVEDENAVKRRTSAFQRT